MTNYACQNLCDSVSPQGYRLTSMEVTYPLVCHNEMLRHRSLKQLDEYDNFDFSHSVGSDRAIPTEKIIQSVRDSPFIPTRFPVNGKGMQPKSYIEPGTVEDKGIRSAWQGRVNAALLGAETMNELGVHKEITNRILSPYQLVTQVITGTGDAWANLFELRCHPAAQEQIRVISEMMRDVMEYSCPESIGDKQWHLPYISEEDVTDCYERFSDDNYQDVLCKISAARCARVSYKLHGEDKKSTIEADVKLAESLIEMKHFSPFEHVARPATKKEVISWDGDGLLGYGYVDVRTHIDTIPSLRSNFTGWVQKRKLL